MRRLNKKAAHLALLRTTEEALPCQVFSFFFSCKKRKISRRCVAFYLARLIFNDKLVKSRKISHIVRQQTGDMKHVLKASSLSCLCTNYWRNFHCVHEPASDRHKFQATHQIFIKHFRHYTVIKWKKRFPDKSNGLIFA